MTRGRERGCPIFLVRPTAPYPTTEEAGTGLNQQAFRALDTYNRARINAAWHGQAIQRQMDMLLAAAEQAGLRWNLVLPQCRWFLPAMLRADVLARREQRRFSSFAATQYVLAAAAIAAGALQSALALGSAVFSWAEVVLLGAMLATLAVGRRSSEAERWIANRALAERLRSRLFLAIAGAGDSAPPAALRHPPDEWIERAVAEVWHGRPRIACPDAGLPALKRFLTVAWVDDQRRYHQRARRRHARRQRRLAVATVAAFAVTLAASLLHALGVTHVGSQGIAAGEPGIVLLVVLTIMLPALASALRSIGSQQENLRNAERSGRIVPYLETVTQRLAGARGITGVQAIIREAEQIIRSENRDWMAVMRLHEPGLDT